MIVYKVTNLINEKIYIGYTTKTLEIRSKCHKYKSKHRKTYFYNAIRKYGWENFKWEVIDTADTKEEIQQKEIYYIKYFKARDKKIGYNLTNGGDGGAVAWTEERKKRPNKSKNKGKKKWNGWKRLSTNWT